MWLKQKEFDFKALCFLDNLLHLLLIATIEIVKKNPYCFKLKTSYYNPI